MLVKETFARPLRGPTHVPPQENPVARSQPANSQIDVSLVRNWHRATVAVVRAHVCCWGFNGNEVLTQSLTGLDPELTPRR